MARTSLRIMAVDDEGLALRRIELLLADIPEAELIATSQDPLEALSRIEALRPDLLLLDIHMAGLGGIELAEHLIQSGGPMPQLVFVTAYNHYAVQAFETRAIDYVLKPVTLPRLASAIDHARVVIDRDRASRQVAGLQRLLGGLRGDSGLSAHMRDDREIWAQRGENYVRLLVSDIEWAESERDYVHIHNQERAYLLRTTMGALHDRLGTDAFLRVRRASRAGHGTRIVNDGVIECAPPAASRRGVHR